MSRVLVVEDDPIFRRLLRDNLVWEHIDVDEVADVAEAYTALERQPNLVLLDIMLGADDGLHFLKECRADPRFAATPIVLLTNLGGSDNRIVGMIGGADDYIEKSVGPREILARVKMHLRRSERERRAVTRDIVNEDAVQAGQASLTKREREVLALLARGWRTQDIAETLVLSPNTVRTHVDNVLEKLGARSRIEAVNLALRLGIIEPPKPDARQNSSG